MVKKIILSFSLVSLLCFTLSGCWDYSEINEYSIIAGTGVDLTENNDTEVTIEQLNWNDAGTDANEQKNIISYTASSYFDAYSSLLLFSGKPNYSSHATTVILGQKYAENGISELIDILIRLEGSRLSMNVAIAENMTAKDFFGKTQTDKNVSSFALPSMLKNCSEQGFSLNPLLFEVGNILVNNRQALCIPLISTLETPKSESPEVLVSGTAVFENDKMVATLNNQQTKTLSLLLNEAKRTSLTVQENTERFSFDLTEIDTKITPVLKNDTFEFVISIYTKAALSELNHNVKLTAHKVNDLEMSIANKLTQNIKTFISQAYTDLHADVLGLSDKIYKKYPVYWESNRNQLRTILENPQIKITTDIELTSTHLLRKSIIRQ